MTERQPTARKVGGNAGKGRKKGVPNKATASIKAAFLEAFERRGGVTALIEWSNANETEFYKLAAKLIPTEVNAKLSDPNGEPLQLFVFGGQEVRF